MIIPFFSKHLKYFILFFYNLHILPQFKAREVDLVFHDLLHAFAITGTFVSLQTPGTSHIPHDFTNTDNNPKTISESQFNTWEASQFSLENLNSFKMNNNSTIFSSF